jgi:fatty-acyl-CoA synthase
MRLEEIRVATIADLEAIEKTPIQERLPFFNSYDLIKHGAAIKPDALAISFITAGEQYANPIQVTYSEFLAQVTRTANLFHDLGLRSNDVVSYILPNLPQCHYVLWGGQAAGIVNPINPLLEPSTITDICKSANTKVLVAMGEWPGSNIWEKALAVRKSLPNLKAIIRVMGPSKESEGIYGYDEIVGRYNGHGLDSGRQIAPEDVASMFHTGGTTGTPKLAPHTHFSEVTMPLMMVIHGDLRRGEATLSGLPLFHVNGTTVTGSYPFSIGAHVVMLSPQGYRDPSVIKNFYKIVEHYKAVSFSLVPTVLSMLLQVPTDGADISSLRYGVCGAAPLSVELFQKFEAHSGMKILEGYGLTEGTCASAVNPYHGRRKIGSIGLRLPYQEMKILIVNDAGEFVREAEPDEIGSVCIKGPNVFKGYLDDNHNAGIWPKADWLNTGDLGRLDSDGYFWLTGRKKELIIRGGHNIDPAAIEEPLYAIPGVQIGAAVGAPDPHSGEIPVAYVQLQEGAELSEGDILDRLKQTVGERAAIPSGVFIIDQIPLTPVGKIFKPALRWDAIRRVYENELQKLGPLAESIELKVAEDKVHGCSVDIKVTAAPNVSEEEITSKVSEVLALYTVKYNLGVACNSSQAKLH